MARRAVRGAVRGVAAALRTRRVVRGRGLAALLTPGRRVPDVVRPDASARAHDATARAFAALGTLARLPGWRNTCLYRAVAECLVLRGFGMPAVVRLGIAREAVAGGAGPVAAHAWVECAGHRCRASDGQEAAAYAPLRAHLCGTPGVPA